MVDGLGERSLDGGRFGLDLPAVEGSAVVGEDSFPERHGRFLDGITESGARKLTPIDTDVIDQGWARAKTESDKRASHSGDKTPRKKATRNGTFAALEEWQMGWGGGAVGILGEVEPMGKILTRFVGNEAADGYVSLPSRFTG